MIESQHIINESYSLLEALTRINSLAPEPLVLFVIDDAQRMVGTLTDGDARRALINGASVQDQAKVIMHRDFNFIRAGKSDYVSSLREQRNLRMRLVPILDEDNHIVQIIDLEKQITILPIDAVIMAGGKGERLRPLTLTTPKPLLPVGDKAIIDHNVDRLIRSGVEHISVTVNYLAEQLEKHYSEPHNGVQIQCVREPKFLGTLGAVQFVTKLYNDAVLVMNSDLFTDIDFEDFYLHFMENDADMSVAAVPYNVSVPYGIFDIDGRNIIGLQEKPVYNYYANAGIYLIKKSALDLVPKNEFFNATDLIEKLVGAHKRVIRYPLNGTWIDIGTMSEYQKAQDLVKHMKL